MSELLMVLLVILLLLVANGLFVAAEFSIVSVPRATVEHRASTGNRLARRVRGASSTTRDGGIGTSPQRRLASRSPASVSGCLAST